MMNGIRNSAQPDNDLVICRCEGVTLGQIRTCIHELGARNVNQVKKLTRAGMGLCQGRTCAGLVEMILAAESQTSVGIEPYKSRPPVRGILIGVLTASADQFDKPLGPVSVSMLRPKASDYPDAPIMSEEIDERYETK